MLLSSLMADVNYIQVPYDPNLQAGFGYNAITGNQTTMSISGFDTLPLEVDDPQISFTEGLDFLQSQEEMARATEAEAKVSGSYFGAKGSASAQFAQQEKFSSSRSSLLANFLVRSGVRTIDFFDNNIDVSRVLDAINEMGYDAFVDKFGTHFLAGYAYGRHYICHYTAEYGTSAQAQSANASLSASYSGLGASASMSAEYSDEASSQSGYANQYLNHFGAGGFVAQGTLTLDNFNANLARFPNNPNEATGEVMFGRMWCVYYDWRLIPRIQQAARSDVNWSKFYVNLDSVRDMYTRLAYNLSSAQSVEPIGAKSTKTLSEIITTCSQAVDDILDIPLAGLADYNATQFTDAASLHGDIARLSDGAASVAFETYTGDGFSPANPSMPVTQVVPAQPGADGTVNHVYRHIVTKKGGGAETWLWGYTYLSPGLFKIEFGKVNSDGTFAEEWYGDALYTFSAATPKGSAKMNKNHYPWMRATVTVQ